MTGDIPAPQHERFPWGLLVLICLALYGVLFAVGAKLDLAGRFLDPDDTMRLVQVRDLLAGQHWFDLHQYRIDPPHSPVMHWSRLVDAPIAGLILLLTPLLGRTSAEFATAMTIPLLTLAAMVFAMSGLAFRLFGRRAALLAGLMFGLAPLTLVQVRPLRLDHHGWQIVAVTVAASALLARSRVRGGWIAGLALATGMAISLEVLPFAAAFAAVMALCWLIDREERDRLVHFLIALATGSIALTLLTRGFGGTIYCDVIGLPHLVFFAWIALAATMIARPSALPPVAAMGLLGAAGAVGLGAFAAIAPQCVGSPFASLDPLVHDFWYVRVLEGQPIWKQGMPDALEPLLQGLVALGVLTLLWLRSAATERRFWLSYLLVFCASLATGLLVWRSMGFTGALGVLPLAWFAGRLLDKLKSLRGARRAALRQATVGVGGLLLLIPSAPIAAEQALFSAKAKPSVSDPLDGCDVAANAQFLNRFAPTKIFAPMDMGPDILAYTRHSVVATAHHRAQASMRDVILAFSSSPEKAHSIITAHHAGLLAICTSLGETERYQADAPNGLMARLVRGDVPAWLRRVPTPASNGFRVWKIVG
jgi:hypothetical protein